MADVIGNLPFNIDPAFLRGLESGVDHRGRRFYIMYHGTTLEAAQQIRRNGFRSSDDGMLGAGVYVSRSVDKAKRYPLNPKSGERLAILKLRVRVGKVKKIDKLGHPLQKTWHEHGYDTAWIPPNCGMMPSGLEEDCVWDPDRIEVLDMWEVERDNGICGNLPFNIDPAFLRGLESGVDHRGRRFYIMYHGTTLEAAQQIRRNGFRRSEKGMLGAGVYVSRSVDKAKRYPVNPDRGVRVAILKLRVRVGKVKKIDKQGHPLQKTWHEHGYDTAWVPPNCGMVNSGLEEDCVWDPDRIEVLDMWEVERDNGICVIL